MWVTSIGSLSRIFREGNVATVLCHLAIVHGQQNPQSFFSPNGEEGTLV